MIQFIIKNFNDNERAVKLADKIFSQCIDLYKKSDIRCKVSIVDDGSDSLDGLNGCMHEVLYLGKNYGELRMYEKIRNKLNKPYFMFIDSDDDVKDDFVEVVVSKVDKLRYDHLNSFMLTFHYDTMVNGKYACTSDNINSISFNLIETDRYIRYTSELGATIDRFESILGYNKITLNSDTYLWTWLEWQALNDLSGFVISSSAAPCIYNIDVKPSQVKYIDRERFKSDEYKNIYDNPAVKERLQLWRKLTINR